MSSAGRKKTAVAPMVKPVIEHSGVEDLPRLAALQREAQSNALELAEQLGYEGALTVPGLEDEIRFYQRRSVEAVLETGKRLLLLKEITEHGEFMPSLERLGIGERMAQRFMVATLKFSKASSTTLLALPNLNQGKLLELLVLDEGEIEALSDGETVRGIKLDDIDCMSVSEMRAAIRKAKREQQEEAATQTEMIRRRDERINAQEEEIARLTSIPKTPAMIEEEQIGHVMAQSQLVVREVEAGLRGQLVKLENLFADGVLPNHARLAQQQAITQIIQAARVLAGDLGITLKIEDQAPQELMWLSQSKALFGDTYTPGAENPLGNPDGNPLDDNGSSEA